MPANVNQASLRGTTLSGATLLGGFRLDANLTLQNPEDAVTGKLLINRANEHGAVKISRSMGEWQVGGELYSPASVRRCGKYLENGRLRFAQSDR